MSTNLRVIIPPYNAGPQLGQFLNALHSQPLSMRELWVMNSGTTDGTPDLAHRARARALTLPQWRYQPGQKCNQAVAAAHGSGSFWWALRRLIAQGV